MPVFEFNARLPSESLNKRLKAYGEVKASAFPQGTEFKKLLIHTELSPEIVPSFMYAFSLSKETVSFRKPTSPISFPYRLKYSDLLTHSFFTNSGKALSKKLRWYGKSCFPEKRV